MVIERCKHYAGYDTQHRNIMCDLIPGKACAGFNRACESYRMTRVLKAEEVPHD